MMKRFSISTTIVVFASILILLATSCPSAKAIRSNTKKSGLKRNISNSRIINNKFGSRTLAERGEETDNIFLRNNNNETKVEDCACDRRRERGRKLGVGHSSKCTCVQQTYVSASSHDSTKKSKKSSNNGKGANSSSHSKKTSKSKGDKDKSEPTKGSKTSKTSKTSKSSKSNRGKGMGKGMGKGYAYDDDYVYPTVKPTSKPTSNPFDPSNPLNSPNPVPTMNPTAKETINPAHIPKLPSNPPTNQPTNKPTNGQKPPTATSTCSVDPNGLYGGKVGISTEFRFLYTAQVIPTVTKEELNIDMLPKAEIQMGNDLLPKLFPAECSNPNAVTKRSVSGNKRERRKLQLMSLNGMSIKPRDTVYEEASCSGVDNSIFPCFVVEGLLTFFSGQNLNEIETFQLENMISSTVSGNIASSDNRFLTITFSEFIEERSPELKWYEVPLEWFQNAPVWMLVLVAMGGVFVLIFLLLCCLGIRRRRRQRRVQNENKTPTANKQPSTAPDVEQVVPTNDDASNSSSNDNDRYEVERPAPTMTNNKGYQYHSNDHINQNLMPNINEPILEERQDDLSSGRYDSDLNQVAPSSYLPMPRDDNYNGDSYEDRDIYPSSSDDMGLIPNTFSSGVDDGSEDRPDDFDGALETGGTDSEDYSRSRSLSRNNQEFRNLDGRDINSQGSPRHKYSNTSPSMYSSDIQSNPSRREEEAVGNDEGSFEDVEEDEYEIVYTSQSERIADDNYNEGFYEEVFVDENDPMTSNSNSNSNMISQANSHSGSSSPNSKDGDVPFVGNTQMQGQQSSSFDSLRRKWET